MSPVRWLDLLDHADPPPGDDEEVDRSLRGDVFESYAVLVLVEELGRNGAVQDLVEDSPTATAGITAHQSRTKKNCLNILYQQRQKRITLHL